MGQMNGKNSIYVYYCRNAAKPGALDQRPGVILEAVPCSGRIDPRYLLKAFEGGAKGVCILGCPKGECKSMEGNLRALTRVQAAQELLAEAGLNPDSLKIILLSDSTESALDRAVGEIHKFLDEVIA
jgi:coenzyme F420-reducing hydrogenase delta subunit